MGAMSVPQLMSEDPGGPSHTRLGAVQVWQVTAGMLTINMNGWFTKVGKARQAREGGNGTEQGSARREGSGGLPLAQGLVGHSLGCEQERLHHGGPHASSTWVVVDRSDGWGQGLRNRQGKRVGRLLCYWGASRKDFFVLVHRKQALWWGHANPEGG